MGGTTGHGGRQVSDLVIGSTYSLFTNDISGNVSSVMISITFYLATNPDALERLQEEVDPVLKSGTFNPKVLNSIMFESFRL